MEAIAAVVVLPVIALTILFCISPLLILNMCLKIHTLVKRQVELSEALVRIVKKSSDEDNK
jgi:hypothetical protein